MDSQIRYYQQLALAVLISFFSSQIGAEEAAEALPPPVITPTETEVAVESRTVYESKFLPGVRLCEESEVDYRGGLRRVNCQDAEAIEAVSTRNDLFEATSPSTFIDNSHAPNGNVLRINFQRKLFSKSK